MTKPSRSPSEEFSRRLPVWMAISELFLDTELSDSQVEGIAKTLKDSGYSIDELEFIYWREVGPSVGSNAMSMVGVWEGFDEGWLADSILSREKSWKRRFPWLNGYFGCGQRRPMWERVKHLCSQPTDCPPSPSQITPSEIPSRSSSEIGA